MVRVAIFLIVAIQCCVWNCFWTEKIKTLFDDEHWRFVQHCSYCSYCSCIVLLVVRKHMIVFRMKRLFRCVGVDVCVQCSCSTTFVQWNWNSKRRSSSNTERERERGEKKNARREYFINSAMIVCLKFRNIQSFAVLARFHLLVCMLLWHLRAVSLSSTTTTSTANTQHDVPVGSRHIHVASFTRATHTVQHLHSSHFIQI